MNTDTLPCFAPFDTFTCVGDTRSVDVGPFTIQARIEADTDTRPSYSEFYDAEHIAAWERDEWCFVGVVLRVYVDGIELLDHAASLWGVECNFPGCDNAYLTDIANDILADAVVEAEKARKRLLAKIA